MQVAGKPKAAAERVYGEVRLPARQVERVRAKLGTVMAGMRKEAEAEVVRQRRRLAKLAEEREKLLHAYYAEAVPLDLLHSEQERLSAETAQAEHQIEIAEASVGDVDDTLGKATRLARRLRARLPKSARPPAPSVEPGAL